MKRAGKGGMSEKKRVTIYDIAREAGVSAATVSRVITGSAEVSDIKREKVLALIHQYHFRPNALAKGLSMTQSGLLGMLVPDVRNPYYASLFMACEREAFEMGYTLILNNTFTQENLEIAFLDKMIEQRVEAILICGGLIDRTPLPERYDAALKNTAQIVPVIIAGQTDIPGCSQISLDHEGGMRQLLGHLTKLGHRRIAFLYSGTNIRLTRIKKQAFIDYMREQSLPFPDEYLQEVEHFNEESGSRGMERLLGLDAAPTAVIGINDLVAAGAMRCALERGLRVPGDCSVAGFDNSYLSDLIVPRMTSIDYNYEQYGHKLVRLAVEKIHDQTENYTGIQPVSLIVKASSAAE